MTSGNVTLLKTRFFGSSRSFTASLAAIRWRIRKKPGWKSPDRPLDLAALTNARLEATTSSPTSVFPISSALWPSRIWTRSEPLPGPG